VTKPTLVVDDEPVNLQALVNYLNLANYDVVTAANGQAALGRNR
jgi:CheY-like chemotaxis protein